MSYSGYKSSPRGSRGYRGGYRGSSRGSGDSWRGGGGGRGYSSSRGSGRGSRYSNSGGGKWEREVSGSYESRPRYNSGGERYSSHGREDGSYRYRGEDSISSYTSREHSHRSSSPDRKRMRPDYSPASSMHRSHDYGDGIEYPSSRSYGGYESKRMSGYGGGEDRRTSSFREERERIRSDDYPFRKPLSVMSPRHSTPRGSSYRGRTFSSRGLRSGFRRAEPYRGGGGFVKKRSMIDSYSMRKRVASGRTQEYLRRLKLYRIQRLRRLRDKVENEGSDEEEDDEAEDGEEEEIEEEEEVEEEVTDDENEEMDNAEKDDEEEKEKKEEIEDEEMEEGGEDKKEVSKKKTKKVKKIVKVIKKVKRKPIKKVESEKDKDEEENDDTKELSVTVKQDSEGRDVDGPVRKNYLGQPFMKLDCPHCNTTCVTFKEYMLHLYKSKHQAAMTNLTVKVRKALAKMRLEQRTEQRDIDEECKMKKMNMRTFYCLTCKLNYRSLKSEHLRSDKHVEMKNFLNPYCKICHIGFRTRMLYESHICSLNHLKRKHYFDKKHADGDGLNEIDMDKYMVLDQVGSGEEEDDEEEEEGESESETSEKVEQVKKEKEEEEEGAAAENTEKEPKVKKVKKKKKAINLGSEYCKLMKIYFCDLCKTFLPRIEDQEQALAVHCRGSSHLRWYVKKKDDLALRKRAERLHRLREEKKKAETKSEEKDEPMDEDGTDDQLKPEEGPKKVTTSKKTTTDEDADNEVGMDDKTWNEVNKDIGDLLCEGHPGNKSSDDEDDSRTTSRRYDRFKHSQKGKSETVDDETKSKSIEDNNVNAEVVNGEDDKDDA